MKFKDISANLPIEIMAIMNQFIATNEVIKTNTPSFVYEGFCLYASIIAFEMKENNFDFYNKLDFYKNEERIRAIKEALLNSKKYKNKNLTDAELEEIIAKNNAKDIRNCFFHGHFEVEQIDGENFFILNPTRSLNQINLPMKIKYIDLYKALREKLNDISNSLKDDFPVPDNFFFTLLAACYVDMACFFSSEASTDFNSKDEFVENHDLIAQHLLSIYEFVFNQNDLYPLLKNYPVKKEELCIYRNSFAHARTQFDGEVLRFIDIDERKSKRREITLTSREYLSKMLEISFISAMPMMEKVSEEIKKLEEGQHPIVQEKIERIRASIEKMKMTLEESSRMYYVNEDEESEQESE